MKTIKIKINTPIRDYPVGFEVTVETDSNGTPLDKYWRRRLKDAEIDNCVEVVKSSQPKKGKDK